MANRKLPFGYEMQQGIVCVKAAEAAIVKEIYAAYIRPGYEGMDFRERQREMPPNVLCP